jgi:tRNA (guanine37-N1)-methyltransferase
MRIDIITLFPEMFTGPFDASIIARARESGVLEIAIHNPRDYTADKHHVVDDYAYGGGPGMVMKPEPLFECVDAVRAQAAPRGRVVLLTPQGRVLDHEVAAELAREERLVLICGHYEGVDERVREFLADDEISIGDYVLSGGEPAAIVLVDAVARHQPGVLGSAASLEEESHAQGLLEYPQYTRPPVYREMPVPEALLSGHHAEIEKWRRRQSVLRTARRRPELLAKADLSAAERRLVEAERGGEAAATPTLLRVAMPVSDIERAAAFYAAALGTPGARVAAGRHDFDCGGIVLACVEGADDDARPNAEPVCFAVPDLAAAFERVREADCQWIERRPKTRDGERSFLARDPFGNPLCFVDERPVHGGVRKE